LPKKRQKAGKHRAHSEAAFPIDFLVKKASPRPGFWAGILVPFLGIWMAGDLPPPQTLRTARTRLLDSVGFSSGLILRCKEISDSQIKTQGFCCLCLVRLCEITKSHFVRAFRQAVIELFQKRLCSEKATPANELPCANRGIFRSRPEWT